MGAEVDQHGEFLKIMSFMYVENTSWLQMHLFTYGITVCICWYFFIVRQVVCFLPLCLIVFKLPKIPYCCVICKTKHLGSWFDYDFTQWSAKLFMPKAKYIFFKSDFLDFEKYLNSGGINGYDEKQFWWQNQLCVPPNLSLHLEGKSEQQGLKLHLFCVFSWSLCINTVSSLDMFIFRFH